MINLKEQFYWKDIILQFIQRDYILRSYCVIKVEELYDIAKLPYQNYQSIIKMLQESIYNLLPRNPQASPKRPIYKSKYPPNIPPTGSTFVHHTTSQPGVSNLSGEFFTGLQAHKFKAAIQTFGTPKGVRSLSPELFQRKRTGTMGSHDLPPIRNFSYDCSHKKQRVPRSSERPIYGRSSNKNFIMSNAVQAILSIPKQLPKPQNWTEKKDYGRTPEYLTFIKSTLNQEYKLMQTLHQQNQQKQNILSRQQIEELRTGLKSRWDQLNKQYQKMTHLRIVDTIGLKRRKMNHESQMQQIEQDIKKLNKQYIFVK